MLASTLPLFAFLRHSPTLKPSLPLTHTPYSILHTLKMTSRRAIALYFILVLAAMTWVSWYASTAPTITSLAKYAEQVKNQEGINVIKGFETVCSEPWGLATMFDAYFGFLAFWLYTVWRERTVAARLGWLVALLLLGNFAIAAYALLCLKQSGDETDLGKIFFTRKAA